MSVLKFFDRIFHQMDLMDRMMLKIGVNDTLKSLPDAPNVLRRASARCRSCDNPGDCQTFLDSNDQVDEAPVYCRNHDLFERLKHEIEVGQAAA